MNERRNPTVAFWIAVALMIPVLYVASFGPACWLTAQPAWKMFSNDGFAAPPRWMLIYWPLRAVVGRYRSQSKTHWTCTLIEWWGSLGLKPDYYGVVPVNARGECIPEWRGLP